MANQDAELYDDLYNEIFDILIDWIQTNYIDYNISHYRKLGYFPYYDKNDYNRIPSNSFTIQWLLGGYLFDLKLKSKIDSQKNPFPLAVLEDEKLSHIHDKIIAWVESHRLSPKFNKPALNRHRCYRPTQYRKAKGWLQRQLRQKLWAWEKENDIEFHIICVD